MDHVSGYALKIKISLEFDRAIEVVTEKLKENGFGVLTEINVTQTLKEKIDVDFKPYQILGACNPPFANRALSEDDFAGVFLPCNVLIWDDGDHRIIAAMNPKVMIGAIDNPKITKIVHEVYGVISTVLKDVEKVSA